MFYYSATEATDYITQVSSSLADYMHISSIDIDEKGNNMYCIGWGMKGNDFNEIMTIVNIETGEIITELFSDYTNLNTYRVRVY